MKTTFLWIGILLAQFISGQTIEDLESAYKRIPRAAGEFEERMRAFGRNPSATLARDMCTDAVGLRVALINFAAECESQAKNKKNSSEVQKAYQVLANKLSDIALYKLENLCDLVVKSNCFTSTTRCNYNYRYDDMIREYNRAYIEGMNRVTPAYSELKQVLKSAELYRLLNAHDESLRKSEEEANRMKDTQNKQNQTRANLPQIIQDLEKSMVLVEGEEYWMGCPDFTGCGQEHKKHKVEVSSFQISKFEVTQKLWETVMGTNYLDEKCDRCPMYLFDPEKQVAEFLNKLNQMTGKNYRLPTEAEWEYAAKGGKFSKNFKYSGSNTLDEVAWSANNSGGQVKPVGQLQPNELGLYDMSGNVYELCLDSYDDNFYINSPLKNPVNTMGFILGKVIRGGSCAEEFMNSKVYHQTYYRNQVGVQKTYFIGFRLVLPQ